MTVLLPMAYTTYPTDAGEQQLWHCRPALEPGWRLVSGPRGLARTGSQRAAVPDGTAGGQPSLAAQAPDLQLQRQPPAHQGVQQTVMHPDELSGEGLAPPDIAGNT